MLEVVKKSKWYEHDIDKIVQSSIEPFEDEWLNTFKIYIEKKYDVKIMTLVFDNTFEIIHVIFYSFNDLSIFLNAEKIAFWQSPIDLNGKAAELSGIKNIQCKICPSAFVPYARDCLLSGVLKKYGAEISELFPSPKPCEIFFSNNFICIFETKEQAADFLNSEYRQQICKIIFDMAEKNDKYSILKGSDVFIFVDYSAHRDQMENHYHQWLEELDNDEIDRYENSLTAI